MWIGIDANLWLAAVMYLALTWPLRVLAVGHADPVLSARPNAVSRAAGAGF
jgi:hypothetical protein